MIKYLIDTDRYKFDQLVSLNKVETACQDVVSNTLNDAKYQSLSVKMSMTIEKRANTSDEPVLLTSNASPELKNSLDLAAALEENMRPLLNSIGKLPKSCLHIDFQISERQKKEEASDFLPTKALYSFSQMILPQDTLTDIMDALKVVECRDLIYDEWGFSEIEPAPKSIINFYGKPGTGKTMCAHAIANKLNRPLLALKYSEIESKYLGESVKNMKKAFDAATRSNAILFFDEADSFLGKRIQNVTQGSEQAINSLRSQMLIQLEEFSGIIIFATNLVGNYDKAFESRIMKHIQFKLPNQEARVAIIKKMLPSRLPLERPFTEQEYDEASALIDGFSGREIKGAVLDMLLAKATKDSRDCKFTIADLLSAFSKKKEELKELEREKNADIKERILRKLKEKDAEAKAEKEAKAKMEEEEKNGLQEKAAIPPSKQSTDENPTC